MSRSFAKRGKRLVYLSCGKRAGRGRSPALLLVTRMAKHFFAVQKGGAPGIRYTFNIILGIYFSARGGSAYGGKGTLEICSSNVYEAEPNLPKANLILRH